MRKKVGHWCPAPRQGEASRLLAKVVAYQLDSAGKIMPIRDQKNTCRHNAKEIQRRLQGWCHQTPFAETRPTTFSATKIEGEHFISSITRNHSQTRPLLFALIPPIKPASDKSWQGKLAHESIAGGKSCPCTFSIEHSVSVLLR